MAKRLFLRRGVGGGGGGVAPLGLGDLTIPLSRLNDWSTAGATIPDTSGWTVVDMVTTYSLDTSGSTDCGSDLLTAINAASGPTVLYFSAGTFFFNGSAWNSNYAIDLRKSQIVIRGAGPSSTFFKSKNSGGDPYVGAEIVRMNNAGTDGGAKAITAGISHGATTFEVGSGHGFQAGDEIMIYYTSAPSWLENVGTDGLSAIGEVVEVDSAGTTTITTKEPILGDYPNGNASCKVLDTLYHIGLEGICFYKTSDSTKQTWHHGVVMNKVVNCWVDNCEFKWHFQAGVVLHYSHHCTVRKTYVHTFWGEQNADTTDSTYAIWISFGSSRNLIADCIVRKHDKGLTVSKGACGNVFSYCYIDDIACSYASFGGYQRAVFMHGEYPHDNLFEGIEIGVAGGKITADNYWGSQGDRNTYFRCRVRGVGDDPWSTSPSGGGWGFALHPDNSGWDILKYTNILGCSSHGFYGLVGVTDIDFAYNFDEEYSGTYRNKNLHFEMCVWDYVLKMEYPGGANNTVTNVTQAGSPQSWDIPESLYLTAEPSWWSGDVWPALGPDIDDYGTPAFDHVPAYYRYTV